METDLKHLYTESPQTRACSFTITVMWTKDTKGAYRLSLTPNAFSEECDKLQTTFLNLDYPANLINSSSNKFLHNIDNISASDEASDGTSNIVVPLPFKDQKSAQ